MTLRVSARAPVTFRARPEGPQRGSMGQSRPCPGPRKLYRVQDPVSSGMEYHRPGKGDGRKHQVPGGIDLPGQERRRQAQKASDYGRKAHEDQEHDGCREEEPCCRCRVTAGPPGDPFPEEQSHEQETDREKDPLGKGEELGMGLQAHVPGTTAVTILERPENRVQPGHRVHPGKVHDLVEQHSRREEEEQPVRVPVVYKEGCSENDQDRTQHMNEGLPDAALAGKEKEGEGLVHEIREYAAKDGYPDRRAHAERRGKGDSKYHPREHMAEDEHHANISTHT